MTAADQSPSATGNELTGLAGGRGIDAQPADPADPAPGIPDGSERAGGSDATDLVAQIRQLAGCDPADVQRVVGDVLAALDRVAGGRLRDQFRSDLEAEGGRTADPG